MKPVDCHEIYKQATWYDAMNSGYVDDIPYYVGLAGEYGAPILELACGTGRITIPVADSGIDITGVDISEEMLALGKKKAMKKNLEIKWYKTDIRKFNLGRKYKFIILPFSSIGHIHERHDVESLLSCVKQHLDVNGHFAFDFFNPSLDILNRDPNRRYPAYEFENPVGRGKIVITENNVYDAASQINYVKFYYKMGKKKEFVKDLNIRIYYPQELDSLLSYNGFAIEEKYGYFDKRPFASDSPRQVFICRKEFY